MVLGFFVGSIVYLALKNGWPPSVMEVSPSLATRLAVLTISLGIACPSASPSDIDHWPSSCVISFLTASGAPPPNKTATAINDSRARMRMSPLGKCDDRANVSQCEY